MDATLAEGAHNVNIVAPVPGQPVNLMLSRLNSSDWKVLEKMARQMVGDAADQPDQDAIWEAEAEEVYRQVLAEKRAEAGYSASPHDGGVA